MVTGVSGSGKSTLAFDIMFNEGQRRYLESLNAYARQFVQPAARPDVDAIFGIPPTVAIEQRTSRGGRKSTVATLTEIYHFLRLLFVKLGTQYCPDCDVPIEPQTSRSHRRAAAEAAQGQRIAAARAAGGDAQGLLHRARQVGATRKGYKHLRVDGEMLPTCQWPRLDRFKEHTIELPVRRRSTCRRTAPTCSSATSSRALDIGKGVVHVLDLDSTAKKPKVQVFSHQARLPFLRHELLRARPAAVLVQLQARLVRGLLRHRPRRSRASTRSRAARRTRAGSTGSRARRTTCETCDGQRLNPTRCRCASATSTSPISRASRSTTPSTFVDKLRLNKREAEIARDLMAEIKSRLAFLQRVGLGYLPLDRSAPTLSGGEAQRIRLAAQLGSNLRGVCYILDEPTIGLHPRDNQILLDALAELAKNGNTLVVVEHDEDTIRRADHVIDLGPGAGVRGGEVVAAGTVEELMNESRLRSPAASSRIRCSIPREPRRATERACAAPASSTDVELHNVLKEDIARPARPPGRGDRRVRLRQVHAGARRAVRQPQAARHANCRAAPNTRAHRRRRGARRRSTSTACSKSTRRRSARRRAPARPPTSASGTTSAASSPNTTEAKIARLHAPAASRSTPTADAARPAKARACRPSR